MSLPDEFRKMVIELTGKYSIPSIANIFLPPFYKGGQPKDAEFMAIRLEGSATGISYVLLPDEKNGRIHYFATIGFCREKPAGICA